MSECLLFMTIDSNQGDGTKQDSPVVKIGGSTFTVMSLCPFLQNHNNTFIKAGGSG